jgi:hypothetical protein
MVFGYREYIERRRAALAYNQEHPSDVMNRATGCALLPAGTLPGTDEILDKCRRLFERKKPTFDEVDMTSRKALREQRRKRSFLMNLLNDEDLRSSPELIDFALSDHVFSIVTNYLGTIPDLNRIDLVYSIPRLNPNEYVHSQLFHQDPEGLSQAKLFINVFDVAEAEGPLMFIPADDSERLVRAIRARHRANGGDVDMRRILDDEIDEAGGRGVILRLSGPAGTGSIVDTTRCLHAGSRVQPGSFRLLLFVQYCTSVEKANRFDAERFRSDPVRSLALKRYAALPPQ